MRHDLADKMLSLIMNADVIESASSVRRLAGLLCSKDNLLYLYMLNVATWLYARRRRFDVVEKGGGGVRGEVSEYSSVKLPAKRSNIYHEINEYDCYTSFTRLLFHIFF